MQTRILRLGLVLLSATLIIITASFSYISYLDRITFKLVAQSKDILLFTSQLEAYKLKEQVHAVEQDLAAKTNELNQKQQELASKLAELDKATQDLVAKNKELDTAAKKIKDQQSQLSANASELSKLRDRPPLFTFKVESGSVANIDQKKEDVKQLVTNAYDIIGDIYSKPYLLHSVTISFVESFTNPNAAAEISISNGKDGLSLTIKIKDFDKNNFNDVSGIIHEVIHSYHGLAVLSPVAYEEGITVAATDVVLAKLIADGKIPSFSPLYIRISQSDYAQTSLVLPSNDSQFYSGSDVGRYYQIAGYGWYQIYKADTNFFKSFNEKLYAKKRDGTEITADIVRQLIKESTSATVQGQSIDAWLTTKAFALR